MLSVLSIALLSACGGGSGTFSPNDPRNLPQNQNQTQTDTGTAPKVVDKTDPTINKFLTEIKDVGQQNSPIVASVDNNDNKVIDPADAVRFNQPGVVSEITTYKEIPEKLRPEGVTYGDDVVVMRDVNNRWNFIVDSGTVDLNTIPTNSFPRDAGTNKITKKRENGVLNDYGGTIDRRFNRILLFSPIVNNGTTNIVNPDGYLSAYFRSPGAAGWSYQTFGYFFGDANNRFLDRTPSLAIKASADKPSRVKCRQPALPSTTALATAITTATRSRR